MLDLPVRVPTRPHRAGPPRLAGSLLPLETATATLHAVRDGASTREAAARLGVPYATARKRLRRLESLGHVTRTFAQHGRPHGSGPLYTWTPTTR